MEVYLDNSATTKPAKAVVEVMTRTLTEEWYNPSALYRPAMEAEKKLNAARETCLKAAGASGQRLIFTSCGTEADNIAICGYLRGLRQHGRVLMLSVEHPAILNCAQEVERLGYTVQQIPVDHHGVLDLTKFEAMLGEDVRLICVMQVNNETGAIQPVEEIVRLKKLHCPQAAVHVDGVQGFLRVPFDFNRLGVDSYAFSGHKIHASKGVGALIVRKGHKVGPVIFGGGQEDGYRSGTENMPGILGMAEAVRVYPASAPQQMAALKKRLYEGLMQAVPGAVLNGPALEDDASAPHILNVSLPPVRSQTMLFALEGDGIYVSAGSACSSHKQKVSSVLTAMGLSNAMADCALRFSLCADITEEQIDYVVTRVKTHYDLLAKYTRR